jgi:hypothetical protein
MLLLVNLVLSAFLTGLIWFVQVVHYPIFRQVPASGFGAYHAAHTLTTGRVVALPMLLELLLGGWLALQSFPGNLKWLNYAAYGLVLLVWGVTFLLAVPLHNKFTAVGYTEEAINSLISGNWIRTAGWTVRTALLAYLLYVQKL